MLILIRFESLLIGVCSQWGGISPIPEQYKGKHVAGEIYVDGGCMIFVPVDESNTIWA